jgi:hypothetical protein
MGLRRVQGALTGMSWLLSCVTVPYPSTTLVRRRVLACLRLCGQTNIAPGAKVPSGAALGPNSSSYEMDSAKEENRYRPTDAAYTHRLAPPDLIPKLSSSRPEGCSCVRFSPRPPATCCCSSGGPS